jgi:hypothetical protein
MRGGGALGRQRYPSPANAGASGSRPLAAYRNGWSTPRYLMAAEIIDPGQQAELYKAWQAIAILPSRGARITLVMRRFFNILLKHAQSIGHAESYRMPLAHILDGSGFNSRNTEVAKEALRSMAKTTVEWNIVETSADKKVKSDWGISTLLSHARVFSGGTTTYVEWSYSPIMQQEILDPSRYVPLSLKIYGLLSSSSSASLYEMCVRYIDNFNGLTSRETIAWWKPRITGVPLSDDDTVEYRYFKRDVLGPAIREINNLTDIEVEVIEFKTGRKITHIQFRGRRKKQHSLEFEVDENPVDGELVLELVVLGFNKEAAAKLYVAYPAEDIRAAIEYVKSRIEKGGVESPAAFVRDALKKGYAKQSSLLAPLPNQTPAPKPAKAAKTVRELDDAPEENPQIIEARRYIAGLSHNQASELHSKFADSLGGLLKEQYIKSGMRSKMIRVHFEMFVASSILAIQS